MINGTVSIRHEADIKIPHYAARLWLNPHLEPTSCYLREWLDLLTAVSRLGDALDEVELDRLMMERY